MKLSHILSCATLFVVSTCDIAPDPPPLDHPLSNHLPSSHDLSLKPHLAFDPSTGASNPPPTTPNRNTVYGAAWCKGERLMLAMTQPPERAILHVQPIPSQWQGSLINEMNLWGYKDETVQPNGDNSCDFGELGLQRVCATLGISTKTRAMGGPHMCYKIVHRDGVAVITQPPEDRMPEVGRQVYKVGERLYRETNAKYDMAINSHDGMITFIDVRGSKSEAMRLWGTDNISPADLPALRALSDITWGLWVRDCASQGQSLAGIKKILSVNIINDDTEAIVDEALAKVVLAPGVQRPQEIPPWPGITFDTSSEAGIAILGSPNGAAIGFFLAQHKQHLGNKYVPRITAFFSEGDILVLNLLAWVEDTPPPPPTGPGDVMASEDMEDLAARGNAGNVSVSSVVRRSRDGRNVVREHVFHAKL